MKVDVWKIKGEVRSACGHVEVKTKHRADYITVSCKNCGLLLDTYYDNATLEEEQKKRNAANGGGSSSNRTMMKYASGGLNTKTGLAWLDGTANAPELVLNARDT